jgi:hypothetical protein
MAMVIRAFLKAIKTIYPSICKLSINNQQEQSPANQVGISAHKVGRMNRPMDK